MIHKYPPVRNKTTDTELSRRIKPLDKHFDISYDILRNARMSFFNNTGKADFTKEIKIWLNKLIKESHEQYPKFKCTMKSIFLNEQRSSDDEVSPVDFEIHSKINITTEMYTEEELDLPGLSLKGPELLRILSKWSD